MTNSIKISVVVFILSVFSAGAYAQAKVVVIPMSGDDLNAVWSQQDDDSGETLVNSAEVEINSFSINVPKDGFLVISGIVYVNNAASTIKSYQLIPKIDGINASPNTWAAYTNYAVSPNAGRVGTMSYTITAAITKGSHTVSQTLNPTGSSDFYYDGENLTAMYFPSGSLVGKPSSFASTSHSEVTPQNENANPGDR